MTHGWWPAHRTARSAASRDGCRRAHRTPEICSSSLLPNLVSSARSSARVIILPRDFCGFPMMRSWNTEWPDRHQGAELSLPAHRQPSHTRQAAALHCGTVPAILISAPLDGDTRVGNGADSGALWRVRMSLAFGALLRIDHIYVTLDVDCRVGAFKLTCAAGGALGRDYLVSHSGGFLGMRCGTAFALSRHVPTPTLQLSCVFSGLAGACVFSGLAGVWAEQRVTSRTFGARGLISKWQHAPPLRKGRPNRATLVSRLALAERSLWTPVILTIDAAGATPTIQTNSADARRLAPLNISFSLRKPCEYLDNLERGPRMGLNRT